MARNPTMKTTSVTNEEEIPEVIPDAMRESIAANNIGGIGGATIGEPDYSTLTIAPSSTPNSPIVPTQKYRVLAYARVNVGGLIAEVRPGKILDSAFDDIDMLLAQRVQLEEI